ncbi:hypothetical protein SGPA1_40210 [Streptomyces misionensis JCM 4497]
MRGALGPAGRASGTRPAQRRLPRCRPPVARPRPDRAAVADAHDGAHLGRQRGLGLRPPRPPRLLPAHRGEVAALRRQQRMAGVRGAPRLAVELRTGAGPAGTRPVLHRGTHPRPRRQPLHPVRHSGGDAGQGPAPDRLGERRPGRRGSAAAEPGPHHGTGRTPHAHPGGRRTAAHHVLPDRLHGREGTPVGGGDRLLQRRRQPPGAAHERRRRAVELLRPDHSALHLVGPHGDRGVDPVQLRRTRPRQRGIGVLVRRLRPRCLPRPRLLAAGAPLRGRPVAARGRRRRLRRRHRPVQPAFLPHPHDHGTAHHRAAPCRVLRRRTGLAHYPAGRAARLTAGRAHRVGNRRRERTAGRPTHHSNER